MSTTSSATNNQQPPSSPLAHHGNTVTGGSTTMNDQRNVCRDGHVCEHGSTCVESLFYEHKYVCDCTTATTTAADDGKNTVSVYAGLSCQHEATTFCTTDGPSVVNPHAFCVNEGTCRSKVSNNDNDVVVHPGCTCPIGYTGEHCQYITGSVPTSTSYFVDGTIDTDGANYWSFQVGGPGIPPAVLVIPLVLGSLGLAVLIWCRWKKYSVTHTIETTRKADANMLEADGQALAAAQRARSSTNGNKRNSTPAFTSTDLLEPPDFDDLLATSDHVANASGRNSNGSSHHGSSTSLAVYNRHSFANQMEKAMINHGFSSGEEDNNDIIDDIVDDMDTALDDILASEEGIMNDAMNTLNGSNANIHNNNNNNTKNQSPSSSTLVTSPTGSTMTDVIDEILADHMPKDNYDYNAYTIDG